MKRENLSEYLARFSLAPISYLRVSTGKLRELKSAQTDSQLTLVRSDDKSS